MREHHTLRLSGRARGVEHIGETLGIRLDLRRLGWMLVQRTPGKHPDSRRPRRRGLGACDDERLEGCPCREQRLPVRRSRDRGDETADAGVLRDVGKPCQRGLLVERNIGRACLENAVEGDNRLGGLLEQQPDPVARADPLRSEHAAEPVRRLVEGRVGQAAAGSDDCVVLRVEPGGAFEVAMDELLGHRPRECATTLRSMSDVPE